MKKILIFGAHGMAGHMIYIYLKSLNKYNLTNVVHNEKLDDESVICDVLNLKKIDELIENKKPDIIINCVGILNYNSEIDIDKTIFINSFFPHYLEFIGLNKNIKIIHLSTDCVFKGDKGQYKDTDIKDESSIYGLSKSIGELVNGKDLTIRTSIIGPELKSDKRGLFCWFMNQKGEVKGYKNVYWSGVTTLELAKAIDVFIDENIHGLYQLSVENKISKYDLLSLISKEFNKIDTKIIEFKDLNIDKSLIPTNSSSFKVSSYYDMIRDLRIWIETNHSIYN